MLPLGMWIDQWRCSSQLGGYGTSVLRRIGMFAPMMLGKINRNLAGISGEFVPTAGQVKVFDRLSGQRREDFESARGWVAKTAVAKRVRFANYRAGGWS